MNKTQSDNKTNNVAVPVVDSKKSKKSNTKKHTDNEVAVANVVETVIDKVSDKVADKVANDVAKVVTDVVTDVVTAAETTVDGTLNNLETNVKNSNKRSEENFEKYQTEYTSIIELYKESKKTFNDNLREIESRLKEFKKTVDINMKHSEKKKKRRNNGEKKIAGFTKPTAVPKKIAEFLHLDPNELLPRPTITKKLYAYISENKLYSSTVDPVTNEIKYNKRKIIPNKELREVLNLKNDEFIEFGTFQRLLADVYRESAPQPELAPAN